MIGQTFTRWTVLERGEDYITPASGLHQKRYLCQCVCGKVKLVFRAHLINKSSQSCGCLNREICTTHGMSKSRAYKAWGNMLKRCNRPSDKERTYIDISYPEDWNDFNKFFQDMGECPDKLELERLDSMLSYSKDNCVWADETTQSTNIRRKCSNTSGKTGVFWSEVHQAWRVNITVNKVKHEGGKMFYTIEEAIERRKELELEHLGYHKKYS